MLKGCLIEIFRTGKLSLFFFFEKYFGKKLKFHGSLDISQCLTKKMLEFYREILLNCSRFLSYNPSVPSTILSQYLWFNKHIKIGNNSAYFSHFSNHGINFIGNLVDINGRYKSWDTIKYGYNLTNKEKFQWLKLVHAIPKLWLKTLKKDFGLSVNLTIYNYNLIKHCQLYTLDKLVSKELYNISLCSMYQKPISQSYYEKLLETMHLNWKKIYILPRKSFYRYKSLYVSRQNFE